MTKLGYNTEQYIINGMITEINSTLLKMGQERRILEERLELLELLKCENLRKELLRNGLTEIEIDAIIKSGD
jgi:hypothetical protein